jgi:hypothetical protein
MDKRTKILASVFGVMIAYGLVSKIIYPTWIEPLVTIDERIAKHQKELDKLVSQEAAVAKARYEYREWAGRTGGFEADSTVTELREHLNNLLEQHKLADVKVTPTRPSDDRKTGLWKATVTVSGAGGLDSVISFLEDVAELPLVCRVGNASISPASRRGKKTTINRFNLRVPVEVWIVPQQQLVGRLESDDLVHPDFFIRHKGRDYTSIWKGDPFNEYKEMRVRTKATMTVLKGKRTTLDVVVEGGVGPYQYEWKPANGLTSPKTRSPAVDASKVGRVLYTVTVADARGHVGNSTISLTVAEPKRTPPPTQTTPPERKPEVVVDRRHTCKDGRLQTLTMVLMRESKNESRDEIMVRHSRTKMNTYFATGDEFEGGQLIFVHQSGGLVNWKDEYFVYPLGETLDHCVSADQAFDYPVLQRAAGKHMDLMREMAKLDEAKKKVEPPAAKKSTEKSVATSKKSPPKQKPATSTTKAVNAQKKTAGAGKKPAATLVPPGNATTPPQRTVNKANTARKATGANKGAANKGSANKTGNAKKAGRAGKAASPAGIRPSAPNNKKPPSGKPKRRAPRGKPS